MAPGNLSIVHSVARLIPGAQLLPPFVAALLGTGRLIRPQPRAVRARVLLRARGIVAAERIVARLARQSCPR
jgi:hypothetical protein